MGLRAQAEADLQAILSDTDGFAWAITLTNPEGAQLVTTGLSNDIAETIDPQTGIAVTGRAASIAISLSVLDEAELGYPIAVPERTAKPWVVQFNDILNNAHTFKVKEARQDRGLGVMVCLLEAYKIADS